MRFFLALGGALALAGCVPGERVTLLPPAQEGKDVGAVVVKSHPAAVAPRQDALANESVERFGMRRGLPFLEAADDGVELQDDEYEHSHSCRYLSGLHIQRYRCFFPFCF